MSIFNVIRPIQYDDIDALDYRARAFIDRHNITLSYDDEICCNNVWDQLDRTLEAEAGVDFKDNSKYMLSLWRKIMNRALCVNGGSRVGIMSNSVGYFKD